MIFDVRPQSCEANPEFTRPTNLLVISCTKHGALPIGEHKASWNGRNSKDAFVSSDMYF